MIILLKQMDIDQFMVVDIWAMVVDIWVMVVMVGIRAIVNEPRECFFFFMRRLQKHAQRPPWAQDCEYIVHSN